MRRATALRLVRFDSATGLPSRGALESRWARFPSYDALSDSIRDEGGRLERGPVRFDVGPDGAGGLPVALRRRRRPAGSRWCGSRVATGRAPGRGARPRRRRGATCSAPPCRRCAGQAQATRLDEARRLILRADSALRAGRLGEPSAGPGRALRRTLGSALGFERAVSLLARGAGTTFGGFCPGAGA